MTDFKHFEYFDFFFSKGKFNIKLKEKFLKPKPLIKIKNIPYTSSNFEYYKYHIENEEFAKCCYNFRKSFFNMEKCSKFFFENSLISKEDYENYISALNQKKENGLKIHKESMKNEKTLEKIKISNVRTAKMRGEIVRQKWASVEGRKKYLDGLNNPDVLKKRIENFKISISKNRGSYLSSMRNPLRIEKIKKAIIERNKGYSREQKRNFFLAPRKGKKTSIEKEMEEILNSLCVSFQYEKQMVLSSREYYPDFLLTDFNIVIECYGDYWHANPKKYKEDDKIVGKLCSEIWQRDLNRKIVFEKSGFELFHFWEDEFRDIESIKKRLCQIIQKKKSALEILQKNTSI